MEIIRQKVSDIVEREERVEGSCIMRAKSPRGGRPAEF